MKRSVINRIIQDSACGKLCLALILLTSFYYPIGATAIIAMGVPSTPVNVGIRAFSATVALFLICIWFFNREKKLLVTKETWVLLAFWIFYSIRIIYDLNRGIRFGGFANSTVYGFAFGNILLPVIAIICWAKHIDIKNLPKYSLMFFAASSVLIFLTMIQKAQGFTFDMFLIRPHLASGSKEQNAHLINPIQIGFYGELLALSSLYFLLIVKKSRVIIFLPLFLFGVMLLFLGASRGPFVSFVLCALMLIIYRYRVSKSRIVLTLKFSVVITLFVIAFSSFFDAQDFAMIKRIESFAESRSEQKEEYRDIQYASAWNDFLDSPIYGKQFVGTLDNFYPHNIILEILMATGLIGGILFGYYFISVFRRIWKAYQIKDDSIFYIGTITLPIIVGAMFSGSAFQSVDLWLMMVLLTTIPMQRRKFRKTKISPKLALQ